MSDRVVLDASAVVALLSDEPGAERVEAALEGSVLSTVNWSEVAQFVLRDGGDPRTDLVELRASGVRVEPLDDAVALEAARLHAATRAVGLSLGDRCCLALAIALDRPALTADRAWADLSVGVDVEVLR